MKNKAALIVVVILVIVVLLNVFLNNKNNQITVGAILPLSGPASLWGETFKNGMDLALGEDKMIKVLYEDSRSAAQDGISAFNNLSTKNVDLMVSELSLISVPLSKLANDRKIPLLVSLVAADRSKIVNDYTIRYYTNPLNYTEPVSKLRESFSRKLERYWVGTPNNPVRIPSNSNNPET
jgi:ABC-type branched-subunit amino acid transport system substrate-binding protein